MHQETPARGLRARLRLAVPLAVFATALLWASWPSLRQTVDKWGHDARYTHGFLVPVFSAYLLWARRGVLSGPPRSSRWGLALVAAGAVLKLAGARYYVNWFDSLSVLPFLAGLALLAGGPAALRWAGPSIAFLVFMIPLPYRVEMALGAPLQGTATWCSNYALQTLGFPAVAEGNVILLNDVRIGVVEACNGLGMLYMFLAFGAGTALVIRRGPWDKAALVAGAVPISVAANVSRITATGVLHVMFGGRVADAVYHDLAGWLMMPVALGLMWAELALLGRLFVESPGGASQPGGFGAASALGGGGLAPRGAGGSP